MVTRRRSGFRQSGARRATGWESGPLGILSPSSTAVSVFPTFLAFTLDGSTIVRIRGELYLLLLSCSAAQTGFQLAFGMAIVSAKAATLGATAVPGPLTELEWEGWMFHWQGSLKLGGALGANTVDGGPASFIRLPIDGKAMRKVDSDDALVGVLETVEAGTSTMHAELRTRTLLKLP